ncbi:hypothetical protein CABS01_01917 [Colletotrichum abscissum]|nr:uncharacterized protein CABS01_01917 [Colletotrichum abscissum]KAK1496110.1 hypothetical protein CABS01_01917 [Colletotrichum abscissum]
MEGEKKGRIWVSNSQSSKFIDAVGRQLSVSRHDHLGVECW